MLGHSTGALASYRDDLVLRSDVVAMLNKVTVHADPDMPETAAHVVVQADQETQAFYDLNAPMNIGLRSEKIRAKAQVLVGSDQVWHSVTSGDLSAVLGVMAGAEAQSAS